MESAPAGPHDHKQEKTVLKKAGIVVAVAAAGAFAVAPLAFAADVHHSPKCSFANSSDTTGKQGANGFLGLLAGTGTAANAAAPVTTQTNAPTLSCNNVSDLVDDGSNNTTRTITNSKVVDNSKTVTTTSTSTFTSFLSSILGG
jgi:hypothetical protein